MQGLGKTRSRWADKVVGLPLIVDVFPRMLGRGTFFSLHGFSIAEIAA